LDCLNQAEKRLHPLPAGENNGKIMSQNDIKSLNNMSSVRVPAISTQGQIPHALFFSLPLRLCVSVIPITEAGAAKNNCGTRLTIVLDSNTLHSSSAPERIAAALVL
jgi:hypothetical protein